MAMDIIYKNETKFDQGNNFSIDLTSNNYIQDKGKEEWLISGLELKIEPIETKAEYSAIKKVSDLINNVKKSKKKKKKKKLNTGVFTQSFLILINTSIMVIL